MIEINNLTNFPVDKKSFSQVAKKVLKGENRETKNISLAFVGKEEIKKLNKKFRKKNKATDVLSFSAQGGPASGWNIEEENYLGEIIICPEVVKENAKKYGISAKEETMKVFVHGILHLLGYDHEKTEKKAEEMEDKEKFYLK
jgi:probable rRNA maturation factor